VPPAPTKPPLLPLPARDSGTEDLRAALAAKEYVAVAVTEAVDAAEAAGETALAAGAAAAAASAAAATKAAAAEATATLRPAGWGFVQFAAQERAKLPRHWAGTTQLRAVHRAWADLAATGQAAWNRSNAEEVQFEAP
jgi:hypothetical protein